MVHRTSQSRRAIPISWPVAAARKLAAALGYSENRLYVELIHEGLLMHEQMAYMTQLRAMHVSPTEGLALLALAPDVEPDPEDRLPIEESADDTPS
jgi:hypothetical protein